MDIDAVRTELVTSSVLSHNETVIASCILDLPSHTYYFSTIDTVVPLSIADDTTTTYLVKYHDANAITFTTRMHDISIDKIQIRDLLISFKHLLSALIQLHDANIRPLCLSPKDIIYFPGRSKPVLRNFSHYMHVSEHVPIVELFTGSNSNSSNTLDISCAPIEVCALHYLFTNHKKTLSFSNIEEITHNYGNDHTACVHILRQFINQPEREIVSEIIERSDTWAVCSLCRIFLPIFTRLQTLLVEQGTDYLLDGILVLLQQNVHPDFNKRLLLNETLAEYNELLATEKWTDLSFDT